MKTCVVRKRIPPYSGSVPLTVSDTVYTPPGFGTPKFAICYYTNGSDNDTLMKVLEIEILEWGLLGYLL